MVENPEIAEDLEQIVEAAAQEIQERVLADGGRQAGQGQYLRVDTETIGDETIATTRAAIQRLRETLVVQAEPPAFLQPEPAVPQDPRRMTLNPVEMRLDPDDGPGPIYRVKCCGSVIQSRYRHDFVWCECGKNAIDGGNAYTKVVGDFNDFEVFDPMLDIP